MSVTEITGDLFQQDVDALAHGVNCKGVMGSGIAPFFKKQNPVMFNHYKALCFKGTLKPGLVFPWKTGDGKWIYNLATQNHPGPHATLGWVQQSLEGMRLHAETHRVLSIAVPRIGAGIGGLDWLQVRLRMYDTFNNSVVKLTIVSLPGA